MLAIGEVHTGLLQHSAAVSVDLARRLLTPADGMRVRRADRPIPYAISPDIVTGVDCELAAATGARVRGVGTTVARVALTGGHVVQGSAFVEVRRSEAARRLSWSHYLARPGVVEVLGKVDGEPLAEGFLRAPTAHVLDLGAIGARAMDAVQRNQLLDHRPALRSSRTRLRWAADTRDASPRSIRFSIGSDLLRTVRLSGVRVGIEDVAALCEDLALHDWLLTTLLANVERARIGSGPRSVVIGRLQPTIDHLIHLWMPTARVALDLADVWESLDRQPGLTRQWQATVDRVRDQLALATVEVLSHARDD